jgi:hypothetical protein
MKTYNELFIELSKKGYTIHNKRVIGDPACTSESTRNKDLTMELALTIEWLRVNFGIWINIDVIDDEYRYSIEKTSGIIDTLKFNLFKGSLFDFNSPQEATEAALKYILEELV